MSAGMQTNVGNLGAGIRPTQAMTGMAKAGTAVSGVQTGAPLMVNQNSPITVPDKLYQPPSGLHPSIESGYGINDVSKMKPAETYTSAELTELQAEFDRQEKLRLAQQQQFAELAQGSGQRATAPSASRVGGGGGGQMTPLNPAAIPKRDDDILTAPFLGRWRNR
jgi:hypothetical protein